MKSYLQDIFLSTIEEKHHSMLQGFWRHGHASENLEHHCTANCIIAGTLESEKQSHFWEHQWLSVLVWNAALPSEHPDSCIQKHNCHRVTAMPNKDRSGLLNDIMIPGTMLTVHTRYLCWWINQLRPQASCSLSSGIVLLLYSCLPPRDHLTFTEGAALCDGCLHWMEEHSSGLFWRDKVRERYKEGTKR